MKINIDGRDYSFKFYHKNDGDTQGKQPIPPVTKLSAKVPIATVERATTCIIFNNSIIFMTEFERISSSGNINRHLIRSLEFC